MVIHLLKPCRIWTGAKHPKGYGSRRDKAKRKNVYVHRAVYEQAHGPVPADWDVHHLCDNKACYELTHLVAITKTEHKRRHAARTHCDHGHEFTPENTYKPPNGWRVCRACRRDKRRAGWRAKHGKNLRYRI